jgi:hypothetical protein
MIKIVSERSPMTSIFGLILFRVFRVSILTVNRNDSSLIELGIKVAWWEVTLGSIIWQDAMEAT